MIAASVRERPIDPLVLALDVGTSSSRCAVYDARGARVEGTTAKRTYLPRLTDNAAPAVTELTVIVKADRPSRAYTLVCDPVGGDDPHPEAASRLLTELEAPFAPVPPGTMCTEVYDGPQIATVTGTLRGEPVNAHFNRTDGWSRGR